MRIVKQAVPQMDIRGGAPHLAYRRAARKTSCNGSPRPETKNPIRLTTRRRSRKQRNVVDRARRGWGLACLISAPVGRHIFNRDIQGDGDIVAEAARDVRAAQGHLGRAVPRCRAGRHLHPCSVPDRPGVPQ
jgi:hypothetical protein